MLVVGITGPSGSGKSTLRSSLAEALRDEGWQVFVIDGEKPYYKYKGSGSLEYEDMPDIEGPDYLDIPQLEIDFANARRQHAPGMALANIKDRRVMIVESYLLLLMSEKSLSAFDFVLYLEAGKEVCRERRTRRESEKSERAKAAFARYFEECIWPGYLRNTMARAEENEASGFVKLRRVDASGSPHEILETTKDIVINAANQKVATSLDQEAHPSYFQGVLPFYQQRPVPPCSSICDQGILPLRTSSPDALSLCTPSSFRCRILPVLRHGLHTPRSQARFFAAEPREYFVPGLLALPSFMLGLVVFSKRSRRFQKPVRGVQEPLVHTDTSGA